MVGSKRGIAGLAAAILLVVAAAVTAAQAAPRVVVPLDGPEQTVFDWSRDACETWDVPDVPARAFRDAGGTVHLIASHNVNRASIGSNLDTLRRDCTVIFKGG